MLSHYHRTRGLLIAGIVACVLVFVFAAKVFSIPTCVGFGGSIVSQPSPVIDLLVIAVALVICVLVGTLIAGTVRFDAGLLCAVVGMSVISFRGGTMGSVLRMASAQGSPALFIWMAFELLVLYGLVGLAWAALWLLHQRGWLKADEFRDGVVDTVEPIALKLGAMAMQAGVMALAMFFFLQTDAKAQALVGVGVAAFVGAVVAYYVYPVSPSPWLWVGPVIVGATGYVLMYFNPTGWTIGQPSSPFAGLARALPIDYATAGPAGAIIGYWMSRKWFTSDEGVEEASGEPA